MDHPERGAACSFCGVASSDCPHLGSVCSAAWALASAVRGVPVVATVVRRGSRVLLCRRPAHKRHGRMWEFPGGKLLANETLGEAVRRELSEELALELEELTGYFGSEQDPGAPFVIHFVGAAASGEPTSLEHDDLAWALPEEILRFDLAPGDRAFVERGMRGSGAAPLA